MRSPPRFLWILPAVLVVVVIVLAVVKTPEGHGEDTAATLMSMVAPILTLLIVVAVGVFIVQAGTKKNKGAAPATDLPGRYKIVGVDKATSLDTTWHCHAQTRANAKAKGELQGIIVTDVEYVGP